MNNTANFLPRRQIDSEYSQLRSTMLEKVQALSGHLWTDYNLHDPGVTILEQLCYALTDINFRSDLGIEDLLVDGNGEIDLHQHGMYMPDVAFPSRPLTVTDYQKYLIDNVDGLAYVYLRSASKNHPGKWDVFVRPEQIDSFISDTKKTQQYACDKNMIDLVYQAYNSVRNLGETINSIAIIEEQECEVLASIEIDDTRSAVSILCEVYSQTNKILSGELKRHGSSKFNNATADRLLSDVLQGPLMQSGEILDKDLQKLSVGISISDVASNLKHIKGVRNVHSITIETLNSEVFTDCLPRLNEKCYKLVIPKHKEKIKVCLFKQGKRIHIDVGELRSAYKVLKHNEYHHQQSIKLKRNKPIIHHTLKNVADYVSVQTQFPAIYGINRYGVPTGENGKRKAQALQLKGYLLLYDQLLADHLAILDNAKNLFSIDSRAKHSYKTLAIDKESINDIDKLYKKTPDADFLSKILNYEDSSERKSRALDFLLAMNGRDKQLFGFEYKNPYFTNEELFQRLLKDKSKLLQSIHELSANRNGGYNCSKKSWGTENVSFIEKIVCSLLGISPKCRSLVYPIIKMGMRFRYRDDSQTQLYFSDDLSEQKAFSDLVGLFYRDVSTDTIKERQQSLALIPYQEVNGEQSSEFLHALKIRLSDSGGNVSQQLLKNGVHLNAYRIARLNDKSSFELLFNFSNDINNIEDWQYVASFSSLENIYRAANQLRQSLVDLNLDMEGMHLIEHSLLAPLDKSKSTRLDDAKIESTESFYQSQLSIVLPDWTARFNDKEFQSYCNDLIAEESPAHLYLHVYWLDFSSMEKFEILFKNWLLAKRENSSNLDQLSMRLTTFLQTLNKQSVSHA